MTVLIADDDKSIIAAVKLLLKAEGLDALACNTPKQAVEQIKLHVFQLALIDLNYRQDTTSGKEGLELVSAIKEIDPALPIIVMTGWGTVDVAVEAMKRGAMDFIEKPWDDNNHLIAAIRTQIRLSEATRREAKLSTENQILRRERDSDGGMICVSQAMKNLMKTVHKVSNSDIPILITGENGTGKSLLANYIHAHSSRSDAPFISVNMGGISESMFESEMFGHVAGAYTDARTARVGRIELADGGTLFMDEIANMPLPQQVKILRLVEEHKYEKLGSSQVRQVSVRIISATNANLDQLVEEQDFRRDLLFRLNGITINLPPLRERIDDILPIAYGFLETALSHYDSQVRTFSEDTEARLQLYPWPGNVRELQHVVERSVLLCSDEKIGCEDLQLPVPVTQKATDSPDELFGMTLAQVQSWFIRQVMDKNHGNATNTAKALGISRSALYRRIGKGGLGK